MARRESIISIQRGPGKGNIITCNLHNIGPRRFLSYRFSIRDLLSSRSDEFYRDLKNVTHVMITEHDSKKNSLLLIFRNPESSSLLHADSCMVACNRRRVRRRFRLNALF